MKYILIFVLILIIFSLGFRMLKNILLKKVFSEMQKNMRPPSEKESEVSQIPKEKTVQWDAETVDYEDIPPTPTNKME